jgi:predicted transcriptional regulator YdeE
VDITADAKAKEPEHNKAIASLWEDFLGQFFLYVRQKGKETNQNIMAGVSFARITKR